MSSLAKTWFEFDLASVCVIPNGQVNYVSSRSVTTVNAFTAFIWRNGESGGAWDSFVGPLLNKLLIPI